MPRLDSLFLLADNVRARVYYDGEAPSTNAWYFLHDGTREGRGYFVGYNLQSKLCLGFIGRDGFRPDQPPVEQWFPVDGAKMANYTALLPYRFDDYRYESGIPSGEVMMISGTRLLEVDLRQRSVKTLMESPDLIALAILNTFSEGKAAEGDSPGVHHLLRHLVVRTKDRVIIFGPTEKQYSTFPIPEGLRDRSIRLFGLDAATVLLMANRVFPDRSQRDELFWINTSGKVLRRAEVALAGDGRSDASEAWTFALASPAPVVLAFTATVTDPRFLVANHAEPNYSAALARSLAVWWPPLLAMTLLSALLAWYCYRRHRRYYQPASAAWFVFVLLTGVPGLVAYLCHRRWPVLEKCPACGQVVPRDREACARCGAAFPAPEPKGCEVFA